MKTFNDIKWKTHQLGQGYIQGLISLDSGAELSIVAGKGLYCLPREAGNSHEDFNKFEVLVFNEKENEPLGWQSRTDINNLIKLHN
tara:strand:+ start:53 stop:310 length:258 start_codon:yes stop_codon:yes gene_type:complete